MKLFHYAAVCLSMAIVASASAQSITLVSPGNVPVAGSSFLMHRGAFVPPGSLTGNQAFNFSALTGTADVTYTWHNPQSLPNGAAFTGADLALTSGGADTIFYKQTAGGLERIGDTQTINALGTDYHLVSTYGNAILELKLPYSSADAPWTDLFQGNFTVAGQPTTGTRTGGINGAANAWGQLTMPGGANTVEVVRVRTRLSESIPMTVSGFSITVTHVRNVDSYYALWAKMPMVRTVSDSLTSMVLNQNTNYTEWLDAAMVGIEALPAGNIALNAYPNPAMDAVEVALPAGMGGPTYLRVMRMDGAILLDETLQGNAVAHRIDVAGWAAGPYQVQLTDAKGMRHVGRFVVAR